MAGLPTFAAGEYYKIQAAIDAGILKYPSYVYIRDEKKLAFVDQDSSINRIVGDNKESVIKVTALPDISEADESILYILNGIVYTFDGTEFKSMYQDVSDGTVVIEISQAEYEALTDEEKQGNVYFIYDDDNGLYCPPLIEFERNEDDNGVIMKVTNYDGSISSSVIYDGDIENIRDEINDALEDNTATDDDIDSLFP